MSDLNEDFRVLGEAFANLYSQALNGVICDPHDGPEDRWHCAACLKAWRTGTAVLDKYDPGWGNLSRPRLFIPPPKLIAPSPLTDDELAVASLSVVCPNCRAEHSQRCFRVTGPCPERIAAARAAKSQATGSN